MRHSWLTAWVFLLFGCRLLCASPWEAAIAKFESLDRDTPPPKEAVLFVGSSTIVGWNLKESFPDLVTINRGFGGSQIADSVQFADRIVIPYKPRAIVFYAGDNDLAAGKSPETVSRDFQTFVKQVRGELPNVPIVFLAIKPSRARWEIIDTIRDTNGRIEAFCKSQQGLTFIPLEPVLLGKDGKPQSALLQADGLHLNQRGYQLLGKAVLPHIRKAS